MKELKHHEKVRQYSRGPRSQELGDFGLRNPEGFLEEESPELGLEE